jgi:hypothetical protein
LKEAMMTGACSRGGYLLGMTVVLASLLTGCGPGQRDQTQASGPVRTLDWSQLRPTGDPDPNGLLDAQIVHQGTMQMPQIGSFFSVAALDGQRVRLPGYVVPLRTDDAGRLREFFFVPFYGACIHVPPPPPNQMIYATVSGSARAPDLYTPMTITGTLRTSVHDEGTSTASYAMEDAS